MRRILVNMELCMLFSFYFSLNIMFPFIMVFKKLFFFKVVAQRIYKESDNIIDCSNWHIKGRRGHYYHVKIVDIKWNYPG